MDEDRKYINVDDHIELIISIVRGALVQADADLSDCDMKLLVLKIIKLALSFLRIGE